MGKDLVYCLRKVSRTSLLFYGFNLIMAAVATCICIEQGHRQAGYHRILVPTCKYAVHLAHQYNCIREVCQHLHLAQPLHPVVIGKKQ